MAQFEEVVRGIPLWLLREYIQEVGGTASETEWLVGTGWRVRLTQVEDFALGSLRVGQVRVELEGETEAIERLRQRLAPKLLRGGG